LPPESIQIGFRLLVNEELAERVLAPVAHGETILSKPGRGQ